MQNLHDLKYGEAKSLKAQREREHLLEILQPFPPAQGRDQSAT